MNDNLARYDLIPENALQALAECFGIGNKKYPDNDWDKRLTFLQCSQSIFNHIMAWLNGEACCPIDGQHHLMAIAARAFILYELEIGNHTHCDNRFSEQKIIFLENIRNMVDNAIRFEAQRQQINREDNQ